MYEEETEDLFTVRADDMPLMNSTMISSISMTSDPNALGKINALQDELSSLRQQIAMLVINQEQINKSQCRFHSKPNFLEFIIYNIILSLRNTVFDTSWQLHDSWW